MIMTIGGNDTVPRGVLLGAAERQQIARGIDKKMDGNRYRPEIGQAPVGRLS
jgi:hypothetical protein